MKITKKYWKELKEDGFVIFDSKLRKLAIYPNNASEISILSKDFDGWSIATICHDEVESVISALLAAKEIVNVDREEMNLAYEIHVAMEEKVEATCQ